MGRKGALAGHFFKKTREQRHKGEAELETELFRIGIVLLAAGCGGWLLYRYLLRGFLPEIPCFFSEYMKIYCPGCGGTRAFRAMLQGRFLQALWYHPLVPYGSVVGGGFMVTQCLNRIGFRRIRGWRYHNWYIYGAVGVISGNFLIKNVLRLLFGITM